MSMTLKHFVVATLVVYANGLCQQLLRYTCILSVSRAHALYLSRSLLSLSPLFLSPPFSH